MEIQKDFIGNDGQRIIGRDAQRTNILAAKTISEIVKTTLGPKGMDKMLVSPNGDITITNDGATILSEMDVEHPVAKMMVEIAKTQESEVGDGTTTSVMLTGKLLENAEKLIDQKIHPTIIVKGYRLAQEKAQEILKENSIKITEENEEILRQIAITAMTGKCAENSKEKFAENLVKAVKTIQEKGQINISNIKIEKIIGDANKNVDLLYGVVLDKERLSEDMPKIVGDAKILLVDFPLEVKSPEIPTKISISSQLELQKLIDNEENSIQVMVEKIIQTEANVVFCQKGIDDYAKYLLAKAGIYACRRISKSDMEKISKSTGGRIISNITEISSYDLGEAKEVKEIKQSGENMTYITGCKNPKAVTILIYAGTHHVLDEIERAIYDALGDIVSTINTGLIVCGGGAIEVELSIKLKKYASSLGGRERLAVEEFANSLEFIPITLAENAGLDSIDIITEMKRRHEAGEKSAGLNLFKNSIENVLESKIIEPYKIKKQAIDSATDVATMILRIDDIILAKQIEEKSKEDYGF